PNANLHPALPPQDKNSPIILHNIHQVVMVHALKEAKKQAIIYLQGKEKILLKFSQRTLRREHQKLQRTTQSNQQPEERNNTTMEIDEPPILHKRNFQSSRERNRRTARPLVPRSHTPVSSTPRNNPRQKRNPKRPQRQTQ